MPIRAVCTICSDFFDHSSDVAAIHCGHTFHYGCLLQWFQSAPTKTCPQCRKQVSTRHIINKLFFDINEEADRAAVDPESLQLQKATAEVNHTKEDMKALQNDLASADKEISSLKKKVEFLQKTLSTPTRTNEALSRLILESPAPVDLKQPRLHHPTGSDDIDLNMTFDITTPDDVVKKATQVQMKKMRLDPPEYVSCCLLCFPREEDSALDPFFRNSLLFRKKTFGSMLDPQRKTGIQTGYDGLGGRTKFFQPAESCELIC
uniref:RING-type domain-containing protein n=1 Tax=Salarias fasciatus TaxID=181472 RepID=A0A672F4J3_SALFA